MTDNEIIERNMELLDISREEATQMLEDDRRIDKGEKLFTLTPEQEKASKKARQAGRKKKTTVYKFDTSKRKKPENKGKQAIITALTESVEKLGAENLDVTNNEREFFFELNGTKYKIVLSMPRK